MKLSDLPVELRRLGRSQADLGRALNDLDPSTVTKMIKGKRRVQAHEIQIIERFMGQRLELDGTEVPETPSFAPRRVQRRIPVYGYAAAGGEDLIAYASDQVLEWRDPPPLWSGAGQLAYVRIKGDSMEERYFAGELAPAMLGVDPGFRDDCLIEFNNGTATIKNFRQRKGDRLLVHQYNPNKDLEYSLKDIRALHAIWRP